MYPDEPIVTGEAVPLDLRTAGVGSRAVATLLDLVVAYVGLFLLLFLAGLALGNADDATVAAVGIVVYVGTAVGYPVGQEWLWRGRTLGKAAMGLRVVRDDGGPIRFRQAFVRGLIGAVVERPGVTLGLAALGSMLVTQRSKRLGDLLAGTVVLQDRVPGAIAEPVAMPRQLAGWAASLDLSAVDDALALRVRQFLARAGQLSPTSRGALEAQLLAQLVARVGPPPPGTPAWAALAAVAAERRDRTLRADVPRASATPAPNPPRAPAPGGFVPPG